MGDGQDQAPHRGGGQRHAALGLQTARFQQRADVGFVVVVVGGLHFFRQAVQKKICVIFDEHKGFCLGEPTAGHQDRRCRAVGRKQGCILLQGLLRCREALGMDVLQYGEKQQLFGIKEFVK